ncbi:MAG: ABC transporter ATP-binding protein [Armatimonadota bacterium]|nr:ABC transporter ATP-binding protein [Armatimonadota bacterium]MDR7450707.1 ABC transporter ATP-binding protein [Armatimonadota bacterium]MDR7466063.1 ABC transporter ATP-binding protein [Armatimonadota bacterium]MDR7493900.1 ABC transporter ATP-binding protein [Armatimonadota bacterium]MDR7504005.1 ABC transporter ATP-binding protein [Armatimonadota bacterium]
MAWLEVEGLSVEYQTLHGVVRAVRGVSLALPAGRALGLVGESGCGKTTLARALIGVLPRGARVTGGAVRMEGTDLLSLPPAQLNEYRWRRIAMVPQAAMDSLDPVQRVGDQMVETMVLRGGYTRRGAWARARELFLMVGLEADRLRLYPHELSGGMKQRAVIALALALGPQLLIADEPVTALDVIVQHQVLSTLRDLRRALNLSLLLITHDISVVAHLCDDVAVMYAGRVVEAGPVAEVFTRPRHPYTMGLRNAFPSLREHQDPLVPIEGYPPDLADPPRGCAFAARCPFALPRCWEEDPVSLPSGDGRSAACHRADDAPLLRQRAAEAFAAMAGDETPVAPPEAT